MPLLTVISSPPPGQRVAGADDGDNWPFENSDSSGDSQADQETDTLVRYVAHDRQIYPWGSAFILRIGTVAVVWRSLGGRAPAGLSLRLRIHQRILPRLSDVHTVVTGRLAVHRGPRGLSDASKAIRYRPLRVLSEVTQQKNQPKTYPLNKWPPR